MTKKNSNAEAPAFDIENPNEIEDSSSTSATAVDGCLTVVIPHFKVEDRGQELRYALRSWARFFLEKINIVVIGDKEDWLDQDNITYIPMESLSNNPQINKTEALKLAIACPTVSDNFIFAADNIYLLAPIDLHYIAIPKAMPDFGTNSERFHNENVENTLKILEAGSDLNHQLNYSTHTPYLFSKELLIKMFSELPAVADGNLFFECIYFSLYVKVTRPHILEWQRDPWLINVVTPSASFEKISEFALKKVFLSNSPNGYTPGLIRFFRLILPDISIYEIDE